MLMIIQGKASHLLPNFTSDEEQMRLTMSAGTRDPGRTAAVADARYLALGPFLRPRTTFGSAPSPLSLIPQ